MIPIVFIDSWPSRSLQLFCTGQTHNTSFLEMLSPRSINHESGSAAYVMPSLQLGTKVDNGEVRLSEYPHIFVIGDAANAFGALKSGSAAWSQVSSSPCASDSTFAYAPSLGGARRQEYCSIDRRTRLTVRGVYSTSCGDQGLVRLGESSQYRCLLALTLICSETPRNTLPTKRESKPSRRWKIAARPWASTTCGSGGVYHWMI